MGFILAFALSPAGLVVSIVALVQSRRVGVSNGWAVGGIVASIVVTLLWVAFVLLMVFLIFVPLVNECQQLGPGVHHLGNTTYTCS